ncbi:MAG TPA: glycosyltransferase family 9 protein [Acidobacteriaceae bacterium]|nr:glycosyltransferase family 9 protein [Acidobacteriaceae bacterium]
MRSLFLRLLYLVLRSSRPRRPAKSSNPTILLLQYQTPLGCCVHCTPIFTAIKRAFPQATLIVAARGLALETFRHDPNIDHLIRTPAPSGLKALLGVARLLRRDLLARRLHPDFVLQDASNRAGSFALLAASLRLAPTVGFANAPELYDLHLGYDPNLSLIDNNLRLVDALRGSLKESAGAPSAHVEPSVYFSASEMSKAEALLRQANPSDRTVVAIVVQGSGGQRTTWHEERFAQVIQHIEESGHATIFLGTAADAGTIERTMTRASSRGLSLAGQTSVPELAAVLTQCDLMVTVDTGTMHVGRAAGLPMVVLGPSWQRPIEWLPLTLPNVRVLRGSDRNDVPHDYQLDEIQTPAVLAAIDELQALFPPSNEAREHRAARLLSSTRT